MSATASFRQLGAAFRVLLMLTVITGVLYPLVITAIGQVVSPGNANGSRVENAGKTVGSDLIAQAFEGPQYFQPRPSAAGDDGYDTLSSSGSNLGPNSEDLVAAVTERKAAYAAENRVRPADVPEDAVTASASGLDPDISPENAKIQAARVAQARGIPVARVEQLVREQTKGRTLGVLGDERVNVLRLNLALAALDR